MKEPAPFSSFVTDAWNYHVFLSFRGTDTRYGFTNNLHKALGRIEIKSFMDHENLQIGDEISPALAEAIEHSMTAIIVFSENYASSTSCLEELVKILNCIKQKDRLVLPIFYKVDPSIVRHQTGSFKKAFDNFEERFGNNDEKVQNWRSALIEAANLKGKHYNGDRYEYDFIGNIVEQVSRVINRDRSDGVKCMDQMARTFDSIADINDDKQTWKLAVRVMSLWESQKKNIVQSLNMTLYDEKLGKIQASVNKRLMPRFKPLLHEGECYFMENFKVAENKQKSSQHKFLLYFQQTTVIEDCQALNIPRWNWVPLQNVLDGQVAHKCLIDVFGEVVRCGNISKKYVAHAETYKKMLEFDLQDESEGRISCIVWGNIAEQLSSAYKSSPGSPLIIALHPASVKLFEGKLYLTNAFYSSKLFINPDMEGVIEFKRRRNSMELSSSETFNQLLTQQTFSNENEWLNFDQMKTISEINDTKEVTECITMATIKMIDTWSRWWYPACQTCSTKIDIESVKATYNCNCERPIICVPKYRIQVLVKDHTQADASFVLFDREAVKLINCPAANLREKMIKEKLPDNHFPDDLDVILGKRLVFKLKISEYNLERNYPPFTVMDITDEEQIMESYIRSIQDSTPLGSINNEAQSSKDVSAAVGGGESCSSGAFAPIKRQSPESEGDVDENTPPQKSSAMKYKRIKSR